MDTTKPDVMRNFLTSYVSQPKYNELSDQEKSQMIETLLVNFEERINLLIVTYCPDDKKVELTNLLKEGNMDKINTFLGVNIPNLEQLIQQETTEYINDLLM
jgi:hypothetical protein